MPILEDGVRSSTSYHGRGMFRFDRIGYENKKLLKEIKKRKRNEFRSESRDKRLIPMQVLQVLWNLNFLPGKKRPEEGMRIRVFLEFLRNGQYRNEKNRALGIWLHDKVEREEFPTEDLRHDMLVGKAGDKLVPVSYLRTIPGTIYS